MENTMMLCRLIDAKYPAYENVIQKKIKYAELIEPNFKKYQAYCHFANKTSHQVIF
jgi:DNA polymerase III sliding clamp (beta) subunit (PCNA family)